MAQELNARLLQKVEISQGLGIFRIATDGWETPDFKPGQFGVLGLPDTAPRCELAQGEPEQPPKGKLIRRAYSVASSSVAKEYIEFYITLVPSGELTPRLFALKPGDALWLGKKFSGFFTLDRVPADKNVIMISTGTGLAPFMSMLRSHLADGEDRHFAVFHGAWHSWELGYRSELTMLARVCKNFVYVPTISEPDDEPLPWPGHVGFVQRLWIETPLADQWGFKPTPENTHIFLCGNPAMIEEMVEILAKDGFIEHTKKNPGQVHVERYW